MQRIQMNGGMLQTIMMLAQMLDQATGGGDQITQMMAAQYGMAAPDGGGGDKPADASQQEALGGIANTGEAKNVRNARARVAQSTNPT